MKIPSIFLSFLLIIVFVSCTQAGSVETTTPALTGILEPFPVVPVIETATSLPTAELMPFTVTPTVTELPAQAILTPTAIPTDLVLATPTPLPVSLTWIGDLSWYRSLRDNMWWSPDSQTLFYQDPSTQEAWGYDLETGQISSIPYAPRSVDELEPLFAPTLPVGAQLFDVSPTQRYALYKIRLSEPIPLDPPRYENDLNPAYFYELWLVKDDQHFKLGLIDNCFGTLRPPTWVADDHIGVVTTWGTPDAKPACMWDNWLVDVDNRTVGPMPVPTEGAYGYILEDISNDGRWLLLRGGGQNYLFDTGTGEQIAIPGANTDDSGLVELPGIPASLFLGLERKFSVLQHYIWYYDPTQGSSTLLVTVPGIVKGWLVSPNQKFLMLAVDNHYYTTVYDDVTTGIWLMELPAPAE